MATLLLSAAGRDRSAQALGERRSRWTLWTRAAFRSTLIPTASGESSSVTHLLGSHNVEAQIEPSADAGPNEPG
jgi:hypothetical protein